MSLLDSSITQSLKNIFEPINKKIELVLCKTAHSSFTELETMLNEVAATNPHLSVRIGEDVSAVPSYEIIANGKKTGLQFTGIPGGHEFSTLVLSILNSAGIGKMPDVGIQNRIKKINGPIHVKTYISLSCENCPDVAQILNQMALIHPNFTHEIIDGGLVPDEIEKLKIQGVPAVFAEDGLLSSGKIALPDLLTLFEKKYGQSTSTENSDLGQFDIAIIGGGPAGASAAIYSARKGLKTAIVAERVGGQVKDTKGIENLISVIYTEGDKLTANLYEHIKSYPITILEHRRVKKIESDKIKTIRLESGEELKAKSIIVATGAKWRELGIPGEREYIGRGVAFCPHCDGPFYKGKKVAVVGGGNSGVEAAIDLSNIASEVILFEFMPDLKADKVLVDKLKSISNASIVTNAKTEEVIGSGEKVIGLKYQLRESGESKTVDLDGVFVQIGLSPNSGFIKDLVEVNRFGEIMVDTHGRTTAKGIYAAGDVTTIPYKQIIISMGDGAKVALASFEDQMRSEES